MSDLANHLRELFVWCAREAMLVVSFLKRWTIDKLKNFGEHSCGFLWVWVLGGKGGRLRFSRMCHSVAHFRTKVEANQLEQKWAVPTES